MVCPSEPRRRSSAEMVLGASLGSSVIHVREEVTSRRRGQLDNVYAKTAPSKQKYACFDQSADASN